MDNNNISLFSDDGKSVVMPSASLTKESSEALPEKSKDINVEKAISGKKVKTVLLPEDTDIYERNFVLDLTNMTAITAMQLKVISALICKDGNTAVYLYKKSSGLTLLGYGYNYSLERNLPLIREHIFGDGEVKIYKNFSRNGELHEVLGSDITQLRLHL